MDYSVELLDLKNDINLLKKESWPLAEAQQIEGVPLFYAPDDAVREYLNKWEPILDRARRMCAGFLEQEVQSNTFPSFLSIPIIKTNIKKIHLNKTVAKDSKTFRGVASLLERCGSFTESEKQAMRDWLDSDDTAALVAHRDFTDLRAYLHDATTGEVERMRFYNSGLLVGTTDNFQIVDHRDKVRKKRSDSFNNPIAQNENYRIYAKYR